MSKMNAARQYIELWHSLEDSLSRGPAGTLRAQACEALERFEDGPDQRTDYTEESFDSLFRPDYGINLANLQQNFDLRPTFHCSVPNISTLLSIVVNDVFVPTNTMVQQLPQGATVMSLARAFAEKPELVKQYLGKLCGNANAAVAVNNMFVHDGVLVHLGKGTKLEKPLQIVNIFNAEAPVMAVRRILIIAEEESQAHILLCDHTQRSGVKYLSNQVVEIFAGENADVEIFDIQEDGADTARVNNVFVRQQGNSHVLLNGNCLAGGVSRNVFTIDVDGPHAQTELYGLVLAGGSQVVDNQVTLKHNSTDCHSNQLFKYALDEDARGAFGGKIVVAHGAERTDAAQTNRNLLGSTGARMNASPQLEIYCDEVKCSHGATTGQLDARQLFYMQTRGIPEEEARAMLTQAFMTDVVNCIHYEPVRERLRMLVERRLSGEPVACASCQPQEGCPR